MASRKTRSAEKSLQATIEEQMLYLHEIHKELESAFERAPSSVETVNATRREALQRIRAAHEVLRNLKRYDELVADGTRIMVINQDGRITRADPEQVMKHVIRMQDITTEVKS